MVSEVVTNLLTIFRSNKRRILTISVFIILTTSLFCGEYFLYKDKDSKIHVLENRESIWGPITRWGFRWEKNSRIDIYIKIIDSFIDGNPLFFKAYHTHILDAYDIIYEERFDDEFSRSFKHIAGFTIYNPFMEVEFLVEVTTIHVVFLPLLITTSVVYLPSVGIAKILWKKFLKNKLCK